jgi:riboflavin kinase/FMN adenylyltransferase
MEHHQNLSDLQLNDSVLTIGVYDGVHRGHQKLVGSVVDQARERGVPSVVVTFFPHPAVILRGRQPAFYLTKPEERAALLGDLGVDYVVTQQFDEAFSRTSAHTYLQRLKAHTGFTSLWIGENFSMGYQREGNRVYLQRVSEQFSYQLNVASPVIVDGEVVSSTRIREALRIGEVGRVSRYLGRWFKLQGTVVRGAGRGRGLGFPTANLEIWEYNAFPAAGVYACLATVEGAQVRAVTNIGLRPTFDEELIAPVIEAHLLDFEGDLYEKRMDLYFVERLRGEQKFSGSEELKKQIETDIRRARQILTEEVRDGTQS